MAGFPTISSCWQPARDRAPLTSCPNTRVAARSILYQRGIYPPEAFTPVSKYGLSILVTSDEGLKTYLVQVLRQLSGEPPAEGSGGVTRDAGVRRTRTTAPPPLTDPHAAWLSKGEVQKLVVVITGVETGEVLERWVFNVETDRAALVPGE